MPYSLEKSGGGYFVVGPSGRKSKSPLSHATALAQMKALYANEPGLKKGGMVPIKARNPRAKSPNTGLYDEPPIAELGKKLLGLK